MLHDDCSDDLMHQIKGLIEAFTAEKYRCSNDFLDLFKGLLMG
jgi:hypothetical protein